MTHRQSDTADRAEVSATEIEEIEEFEARVATGERVLVDFYADWCGPCQMMAPTIDDLATEFGESRVLEIDVEVFPELADQYAVRAIPAFLAFVDGEVQERFKGVQDKATLAHALK